MDTATVTTEIILLGIALYLLFSKRPEYVVIKPPPIPDPIIVLPPAQTIIDTERKIFCKSFVSQAQPFDDDFMSFN